MRAMWAMLGDLPTGPGWAYEMCWTGRRLLVDVTVDAVVAHADQQDVTPLYPELVSMGADLPDALLDGVVVAVGDMPKSFVAVDLLRLYGVDLTTRTYTERHHTLKRIGAARRVLTVSPAFDDPAATAAAARQHGLPGVIAKRLSSPYRPGRADRDWVEHRFAPDRARIGPA